MSVCWPPVVASQFAIYLSLSNLARSVGAGLFALVAGPLGVVGPFYAMAALLMGALAPHRQRLRAQDAAPTSH